MSTLKLYNIIERRTRVEAKVELEDWRTKLGAQKTEVEAVRLRTKVKPGEWKTQEDWRPKTKLDRLEPRDLLTKWSQGKERPWWRWTSQGGAKGSEDQGGARGSENLG